LKFLLILLTALFQFTFQAPKHAPIVPKGEEFQHAATHHIKMENIIDAAGCSATAVGPHTLLTAGHCFVPSHKIQVDDETVKVLGIDYDDNDHLLVRVDKSFGDAFVYVTPREFADNEIVHMWGNPGRSRDVYRIGEFERVEDDNCDYFLMPGAPGDSGSGIFDVDGKIVGVLSVGNQSGEVGAFVLDFTPEQLAAARK
jgi:hypothetical protein